MDLGVVIPVLIAAIVVILVIILTVVAKGGGSDKKKNDGKVSNRVQKKGANAVIKEYEKKLAHDPHNVAALEGLGDAYYGLQNWEKVWSVYKTLYDISAAHPEVNLAVVARRMGIAAFSLGKFEDALNSLLVSNKREPDVYETNYYLGRGFYEKNMNEKAIICFKKCKLIDPHKTDVNEYLARALFKLQKYKDSLPFLKKVLDEQPGNKELLFDMAVAMSECGMNDKALKIFVHLRPDPMYGALSCLEAGKMHEKTKDYKSAIQDYEIGMKLTAVPEQTLLQIKYRCATSYINTNNIAKGLQLLKQIQQVHAGYKDVDSLVLRYSELTQNKNLQTYLLAGTSDFVALCRKFISAYYTEGYVKIEDVAIASESIEVICSVESAKWEAKAMFRFYRTQTVIGDIYVREFHTKMRDSKCDNGFCVTMGSFSDSAHKYIEGRPIDLIEKDELCKILKKIQVFN